MALGSIAPFSWMPLLRGLPATARVPVIRRGGFGICKGTEGVIWCFSSDNRRLSLSPISFPLGRFLRRRAEPLGAELRLVRGKSSVNRQGLGAGESSRSTNPNGGLLILYSKPGCCLCDGLKEKLEGSDMFSGIHLESDSSTCTANADSLLMSVTLIAGFFHLAIFLSDCLLEVRDITTNSEWWNLYQYEIPVLARVRDDGIEEALPRLSPRLSAQQVQKKILALMSPA